MKAAILREVNRPVGIEEVEIDKPGPREVLVRTRAAGVCGSDLHFVQGTFTTAMPVVLGHEGSGTVEAVGDQVTYVKPGDRVVACLSVFCGKCNKCLSGRPNLCTRVGLTRSSDDPPKLSQDGKPINGFSNIAAFAERMLLHENGLVKVSDDLPFEQLALLGCGVVTGVGAVLNTARVEPGSSVAVIGCGGVGLNCIQGSKIAGAGRVIAVDPVAMKLEIAREFGATDVIDASEGGVVDMVREMTGGGVDYSFDAIGKTETVEQAWEMVGPGGTATIVGMIPLGSRVSIDGLGFLREKRIQGCTMGSNRFRIDLPRYIEFYKQGRLKLDELVSQRLKLEQINKAFDDMKQGRVARSVITFS